VIGTLATQAANAGIDVLVSTGDKDLAQLVNPQVRLINTMSNTTLDEPGVVEKFGVRADQIADYLALMGDAVDNIPGVPGVGRKTAAALLERFDSLDHLYANLDSVATLSIRGAKNLGARLLEHRAVAYLARELTRIACDMPLSTEPPALRRCAPDLALLGEFYDRAGFGPMLRRQAERIALTAQAA
jgi:DNA polymerase-1